MISERRFFSKLLLVLNSWFNVLISSWCRKRMWKACLYFLLFSPLKMKSVMNTCQMVCILVWCYFLKLGNSTVSVKSQYFDQNVYFFFSSESDQWFKCHVKFWCAATCKFHKARKHRDFRTKHFITSARSSKFNSNIYKLLLLCLVLCFCTKNACSIILMNVLCLTLK